ncbi:MAG: hypothetical protein KH359_04425 [Clostridiales bacterium]|nr:hypothetical protein [Clostridiales bacterium]
MTSREVLELIKKLYEERGAWISDIAKELHAPYEIIRGIIVNLGYYRGRKIKDVDLDILFYDNDIRSSLEKIASSL